MEYDEAESALNACLLLVDLGRTVEALDELRAFISSVEDEGDAETWRLRGHATATYAKLLDEAGDSDEAIAMFGDLCENFLEDERLRPIALSGMLRRSFLLEREGDRRKAVAVAEALIQEVAADSAELRRYQVHALAMMASWRVDTGETASGELGRLWQLDVSDSDPVVRSALAAAIYNLGCRLGEAGYLEVERSRVTLTGQAACFCSAPCASSHVARTSRGVL